MISKISRGELARDLFVRWELLTGGSTQRFGERAKLNPHTPVLGRTGPGHRVKVSSRPIRARKGEKLFVLWADGRDMY